MIRDYFKLAFSSLSHRRLRSWLTMIGIFIGIASVVALIGLGEGLRTAITSQFGFLGTDILSIQASGIGFAGSPGRGAINPLKDNLVDKIRRINGVDVSFNRYIESARIEFNDRQEIGFIATIPGGENRKAFEIMVNLQAGQGRLLKDGDRKGVLIGYDYSQSAKFGKGINVGDRITVDSHSLVVVGILKKKGSFIFDNAVFLNEDTLFDIFGRRDTVSVIAVKVKDVREIERVSESINKLLRKERNVKEGEEDFQVQSPQKALEALNSTLFAVQLFVYIIAFISLVVGGIGIMNTMYTVVLERTREIGIMKAIGARNSVIFFLFFIESGFLGLVGGIIGILIGMGLAYGLAFAGKMVLGSNLIQANVSILLIVGSLLFSTVLGTLFGVLPAYRASRQQPVEALRS